MRFEADRDSAMKRECVASAMARRVADKGKWQLPDLLEIPGFDLDRQWAARSSCGLAAGGRQNVTAALRKNP